MQVRFKIEADLQPTATNKRAWLGSYSQAEHTTQVEYTVVFDGTPADFGKAINTAIERATTNEQNGISTPTHPNIVSFDFPGADTEPDWITR